MINIIERDPRDIAYAALYIAIIWYKQLTPEEAYRIIDGKWLPLPARPITPEDLSNLKKTMMNTNYVSLERSEKRHRFNRYELMDKYRKFYDRDTF